MPECYRSVACKKHSLSNELFSTLNAGDLIKRCLVGWSLREWDEKFINNLPPEVDP